MHNYCCYFIQYRGLSLRWSSFWATEILENYLLLTGLHEPRLLIWLHAFGNFYREVIDAVGTIAYLLSVFVYIESLQVSIMMRSIICIIVNYRTVGFGYKVLICANYASCCELTNFNSAVTLALSFQLTAHVTVLCLWFLYLMSLFKYFKRGTLLLCCLTQKSIGSWWLCESCARQYCNTPPM